MECICGSGHDSVLHEQAVNKTRVGSLRLSRIGLRIGSDSGSDQIGSDRIGSDRIDIFAFGVEELF